MAMRTVIEFCLAFVSAIFLFVFLARVYFHTPRRRKLYEHQKLILSLFCGLLAGIVASLMTGVALAVWEKATGQGGRLTIQTTAGIAVFIIVFVLSLWWLCRSDRSPKRGCRRRKRKKAEKRTDELIAKIQTPRHEVTIKRFLDRLRIVRGGMPLFEMRSTSIESEECLSSDIGSITESGEYPASGPINDRATNTSQGTQRLTTKDFDSGVYDNPIRPNVEHLQRALKELKEHRRQIQKQLVTQDLAERPRRQIVNFERTDCLSELWRKSHCVKVYVFTNNRAIRRRFGSVREPIWKNGYIWISEPIIIKDNQDCQFMNDFGNPISFKISDYPNCRSSRLLCERDRLEGFYPILILWASTRILRRKTKFIHNKLDTYCVKASN